MTHEFPGFTRESFKFFDDLKRNNYTAWFKDNRERYDRHIVGVFRGLLASLEPFLLNLDPQFETSGKTNGNFSRINRDIRFSKDKSPYKSNFYLYVFDGRHKRDHGGRFYVGLSAECVTVGFSIYSVDEPSRKREGNTTPSSTLAAVFRPRVQANPKLFGTLLKDTIRGKKFETYWYRVEKGNWTQHAGLPKNLEDWQSVRGWVVRKVFPRSARVVQSPGFAKQVGKIFTDLFPVYVFTSVEGRNWQKELKRRIAPK